MLMAGGPSGAPKGTSHSQKPRHSLDSSSWGCLRMASFAGVPDLRNRVKTVASQGRPTVEQSPRKGASSSVVHCNVCPGEVELGRPKLVKLGS